MDIHIGNNIKKISEKKNIKAREIAYRWNKSTQAVYNLFKNPNPTADVIYEMSKILNVPITEFFEIDVSQKTYLNKPSDTLNNVNEDFIIHLKNQLKNLDEQMKNKDEQINSLLEVLKSINKQQ